MFVVIQTKCESFSPARSKKGLQLFLNYKNLSGPGFSNMYYRKVTSSNTSRIEAHAGFFRLLMKGIFDPYLL